MTKETIMDSPEKLLVLLNQLKFSSSGDSAENDESSVVLLDSLKLWNEGIETSLSSPLLIENLDLIWKSIENCTILLHQNLLQFLFHFSLPNHLMVNSISWEPCEKDFSTDDDANQISRKMAESCFSLDNNDEKASIETNKNCDKHIESFLSELLRACKNMIRWSRKLRIDNKKTNSQLVNPVRRLQSVGMIMLLLHILDVATSSNFILDAPNSSPLDGVARHASLSLFNAIFGQMEAEASRGRLELVETCNGIPILMKILTRKNPVPLMLSLVRNVHNLVGTAEGIIEKMDQALKELSEAKEHENYNLLFVMVNILSHTVQSSSDQPPFPGSNNDDRRSDLAIEILRVLFVLSNQSKASIQDLEKTSMESMTQIGSILVDILLLPNTNEKNKDDRRAYECKLAAIQLLMDSPAEYGLFLMKQNAMEQLLIIFELQLTKVVVERAGQPHGAHDAVLILPILVVLNKYASANYYIRKMVKEKLFPPELEDAFVEKVRRERALVPPSSKSGKLGAKNMKPIDAPKGTLRWKMSRLLTWPETSVKRYAGELLWSLFDKNSTEFILRMGLGNAMHFLSIKGLVKIPEQTSASVMR